MGRAAELALAPALAILAAGAGAGTAVAQESLDRAARTEELRKVELAFAASVMENKPEVFAAFLDDEAVFVGGAGVRRGRSAIVEAWKGFFAAGRPEFEWHPEVVELSADGLLGLTRGPWTMRSRDPDGKAVEQTGTFNSVWRRQADGSWRIVFDAGCAACGCGQ